MPKPKLTAAGALVVEQLRAGCTLRLSHGVNRLYGLDGWGIRNVSSNITAKLVTDGVLLVRRTEEGGAWWELAPEWKDPG